MKKNYSIIFFLQQALEKRMELFILSALKANGGSISFTPEEDEDIDFHEKFPAFGMFSQKWHEEEVGFTRVYLDEHGYIMAEGIERDDLQLRTGLYISTLDYSSICYFISFVLKLHIYDFMKGELVYWQDTDDGTSSGFYRIYDFDKETNDEILEADSGYDNRVFSITNGVSEADVYGKKLFPVNDEILRILYPAGITVLTTTILGKNATEYYEENNKIPSLQWLQKNDGEVIKNSFNSLAELHSYTLGLKQGGCEDYAIVTEVKENRDIPDCVCCESWRNQFKDNKYGAYCPSCGKHVIYPQK